MDDSKAKAAAYRERAQKLLRIAEMVTRDDARLNILSDRGQMTLAVHP